MNSSNNTVPKLVEIIKGMKPLEQEKCIKKIITTLSNSKLKKTLHVDEWLQQNGFLSQEEYII